MIQIEYPPVVLTGLGLTASIIYYANVLSNSTKTQNLALETRQAQLFIQMYNRWLDTIGLEDYGKIIGKQVLDWGDFKQQYNYDEEYKRIFNKLAGFYEGMGVLVKAGYLTIHPVALMWTGVTTLFWNNVLSRILDSWRAELGLNRLWSEAEYLCRELVRYIDEHPELAP